MILRLSVPAQPCFKLASALLVTYGEAGMGRAGCAEFCEGGHEPGVVVREENSEVTQRTLLKDQESKLTTVKKKQRQST